jgi:hypothetical protein
MKPGKAALARIDAGRQMHLDDSPLILNAA